MAAMRLLHLGSGPWAAVQSGEIFLGLRGLLLVQCSPPTFVSPRAGGLFLPLAGAWVLIGEDGPTMFYGTHFIMSPPARAS